MQTGVEVAVSVDDVLNTDFSMVNQHLRCKTGQTCHIRGFTFSNHNYCCDVKLALSKNKQLRRYKKVTSVMYVS